MTSSCYGIFLLDGFFVSGRVLRLGFFAETFSESSFCRASFLICEAILLSMSIFGFSLGFGSSLITLVGVGSSFFIYWDDLNDEMLEEAD